MESFCPFCGRTTDHARFEDAVGIVLLCRNCWRPRALDHGEDHGTIPRRDDEPADPTT